jgi:hypothetical protein
MEFRAFVNFNQLAGKGANPSFQEVTVTGYQPAADDQSKTVLGYNDPATGEHKSLVVVVPFEAVVALSDAVHSIKGHVGKALDFHNGELRMTDKYTWHLRGHSSLSNFLEEVLGPLNP